MADIITYPENGIEYDSDDASGYLATRTSGVYSCLLYTSQVRHWR